VSPDGRTGDRPRGQPEAGKALVYFIEDDREYDPPRNPTMLASLDAKYLKPQTACVSLIESAPSLGNSLAVAVRFSRHAGSRASLS
jgi:hypothetical protein